MRYQFKRRNRPAGPVREHWAEAAQDVVDDGCGEWEAEDSIKFYPRFDAMIERIPDL